MSADNTEPAPEWMERVEGQIRFLTAVIASITFRSTDRVAVIAEAKHYVSGGHASDALQPGREQTLRLFLQLLESMTAQIQKQGPEAPTEH